MCAVYAKIILDVAHTEVDRVFDYIVPERFERTVAPGMRVLVPFGKKNTKTEGYIISLSDYSALEANKLKAIAELLEPYPVFSKEMLQLAQWMREKCFTTLSQCLQTIMPAGIKVRSRFLVALGKQTEHLTLRQKEVIDFIKEQGGAIEQPLLEEEFGKSVLKILGDLQKKEALQITQMTEKKDYTKWIRVAQSVCPPEKREELSQKALQNQRLAIYSKILEKLSTGQQAVSKLMDELGISSSPLKTLEKKGLIRIFWAEQKRAFPDFESFQKENAITFTTEQQEAYLGICEEMEQKKPTPCLLHGVTGSGKTEIYIKTIQKTLSQGKSAIVLVPEISLTPQTVGRFSAAFGTKVALTHSRMNYGERLDIWKMARNGEISVVIGPRSAVFAPFTNLGVIIIDEEQESSYQSETTPKYDAREVAKKRCELSEALLLMGSATPSIQTYQKAVDGEFRLFRLTKRPFGIALPKTEIVDMRQELAQGNRSIFSRVLIEKLKNCGEKGTQAMLLINRRGFSTFVSCRKCGHVMMCDNCNVSYTYHADTKELRCHYCGKKIPVPTICPQCGSKYIKYFGTGTQKVQQEVEKLFPSARVLRMDLDTTAAKGSHEQILSAFSRQEADILIGTQMIAKGHDFPHVSLVGIIAADLSLYSGDYHGGETTFQLLTQMAGRAGRDQAGGDVVIQTYQPENHIIQLAAKQDYEAFFLQESQYRKMMQYPPYAQIFVLLFTGIEEKKVAESIQDYFYFLSSRNKEGKFEILGPTPAAVSKIKKEYRYRIMIKYEEEEPLRTFVLESIQQWRQKKQLPSNIMIQIYRNPNGMI